MSFSRVAAVAAVGILALSSAGIASIGGSASFLAPQPSLRGEADGVPAWASDVAFQAAGLCSVMMVVDEPRPGTSDIVDVTLGASETADLEGLSVACGSGDGLPRRFGAAPANAAVVKGDLAAL